MIDFTATLQKEGRYAVIYIPFDIKKKFSISKGTMQVKTMMNNIEYRTKLVSKGNGQYIIIVDKKMQQNLGFINQNLQVSVKLYLENQKNEEEIKFINQRDTSNFILEAIYQRSSIRQFNNITVENQKIDTIVKSGFCAPSAKNKKPFHFIVIDNPNILRGKDNDTINTQPLETANKAIIICGDINVEGTREFLYTACGAAVQNMLLTIHSLGLGSVWIGVDKTWANKIVEAFNIPTKTIPLAIIALGYPKEYKVSSKSIKIDNIHYQVWGGKQIDKQGE